MGKPEKKELHVNRGAPGRKDALGCEGGGAARHADLTQAPPKSRGPPRAPARGERGAARHTESGTWMNVFLTNYRETQFTHTGILEPPRQL